MKYLIEALVILVFVFAALAVVLIMVMAHQRRTVRSWQSPGGLAAMPGRHSPAELPAVTGRAVRHDAAGACCLVVPCSAECARRQQSVHTAAYLSGMSDTISNPNTVRRLVQEGQQLDYGDDAGERRPW
jgi:hypothetical protein